MRRASLASLVMLGAAGCGASDFEPPDRGERIEAALAEYSPALFDSVLWSGEEEQSLAGNTVYAERCVRCHGPLGGGDTEYSRSRTLTVPSLVEPDWGGASLDSVRRSIYAGHEVGMPTFRERQLTPREIDAAARYVLFTLRPDVLGGP